MIEAILFDFGQTLVDSSGGFRQAEKEAQHKIFKNLGVESWAEFLANYRRFRRDFHARSIFSRVAVWQEAYIHYEQEPDLGFLLAAEHDYWETVQSATRLFPETKAVLEQLASDYRLGMITNGQGQQSSGKHRVNRFPELEGLFELIIVAGEGGIPPKPDPQPFLMCLENMGLAPGETVYVGDEWVFDVCGSSEVGIQPVWLQHHSVSRKWPVVKTSAPIITSLEQLLDLYPSGTMATVKSSQ